MAFLQYLQWFHPAEKESLAVSEWQKTKTKGRKNLPLTDSVSFLQFLSENQGQLKFQGTLCKESSSIMCILFPVENIK